MKNIKRTVLGEKIGRIHMEKQNLDKMGGRRVSALRGGGKRPSSSDIVGAGEISSGGDGQSPKRRKLLSSKSV